MAAADPDARALFPTTCWSRILPARGAPVAEGDGGLGGDRGGDTTAGDGRAALETLARLYWRPIHAYLRRALGRRDDEARDLTQDVFVWMIETDFLARADPARGRFRAFLKTALRHYVADHDRKGRALKRGGGRAPLALDALTDGEGPLPVSSGERTPEEILDDAWRAEAVRHALVSVERRLSRDGRQVVFDVFSDYFLDPEPETDHRAVAARHGVSTTDVSNHLRRAKQLYREELRRLVADTVSSPADLEEELAWLLGGAGRAPRRGAAGGAS